MHRDTLQGTRSVYYTDDVGTRTVSNRPVSLSKEELSPSNVCHRGWEMPCTFSFSNDPAVTSNEPMTDAHREEMEARGEERA